MPVALDAVRIPVKRDGKDAHVGLAEATVAEIAAATRSDGAPKNDRRSPVERALYEPLAADRELRDVKVRHADGRVSFTGVPLTAFDRFLAAERKVDWRAAVPGRSTATKRGAKGKRKR